MQKPGPTIAIMKVVPKQTYGVLSVVVAILVTLSSSATDLPSMMMVNAAAAAATTTTDGGRERAGIRGAAVGTDRERHLKSSKGMKMGGGIMLKDGTKREKKEKDYSKMDDYRLVKKDGGKGSSKSDPKYDYKMDGSGSKSSKKMLKVEKDGGGMKMGNKSKSGKETEGMKPVRDVQPVILDTDYGPFIDDIFAVGLLINSADLLDTKMIITTSEQPELSAKCVWEQIRLSQLDYEIPVGIGRELPPYEQRASVCGIPGLVGFALEGECKDVDADLIPDGVAAMAEMIMASDRDDWWYIAIGGQTSLMALVVEYPEAAAKIETLIAMGGNWCAGFEPYPGVMAPTDETNIGCDPVAANFVLDTTNVVFKNVYYTPVVVADEIGNDFYSLIVKAANSGESPSAKATLDFYKAWSAAARADPDLLVHAEAMTYDPEIESTPQFDACAIMLALDLASAETCDSNLALFDFPAVHFYENTDEGLAPFPDAPRSAFSLWEGEIEYDLPTDCPSLTEFTFDADETPEVETPVTIALGFKDPSAKLQFYNDMAKRMAGEVPDCSRRRHN